MGPQGMVARSRQLSWKIMSHPDLDGQSPLEPRDLAIVMRFVFAHVKPLAVIVRGPRGRIGIDLHEPGVISLLKFRESVLPHFLQLIEVIGQVVFLDAFSRFLAQTRRRAPLLFCFPVNIPPLPAVESMYLVESFDSREMEE